MAKNIVLAGEYQGKGIAILGGNPCIMQGFSGKAIIMDSASVTAYQVITDDIRKSAASGVARGLVGGALLGPVGMLAGGLSAKNKGTYQVAVQWKTGTQSLIEIDNKIYAALVKSCFAYKAPAGQQADPQPSGAQLGVADEIAKLKQLKDDGVLNDEEFQAQKEKLLKASGQPANRNSASPKPAAPASNEAAPPAAPPKKKNTGCLVGVLVVLCIAAVVFFLSTSSDPADPSASNGSNVSPEQAMADIDRAQATPAHYDDIVEFVNQQLAAAGYTVTSASAEWIGYSNYIGVWGYEEFLGTEMGGYYTYYGNLLTGEIAAARLYTYWEGEADPVILDLSIDTAASDIEIIPWSEDAMGECWDAYISRAESLIAE